jgi:hypothetical protein
MRKTIEVQEIDGISDDLGASLDLFLASLDLFLASLDHFLVKLILFLVKLIPGSGLLAKVPLGQRLHYEHL